MSSVLPSQKSGWSSSFTHLPQFGQSQLSSTTHRAGCGDGVTAVCVDGSLCACVLIGPICSLLPWLTLHPLVPCSHIRLLNICGLQSSITRPHVSGFWLHLVALHILLIRRLPKHQQPWDQRGDFLDGFGHVFRCDCLKGVHFLLFLGCCCDSFLAAYFNCS